MSQERLMIHRLFSLCCFLIALYYVFNQILVYFENADVSQFSFKQYHSTKIDKYPTYSICLSPDDYEWVNLYQSDKIKEALNMTEIGYFEMLSGVTKGIIKFSNLEFDDAKWDLGLILQSYGAYSLQTGLITLNYWDFEMNDTGTISFAPFYTSYQNPGVLCITRNEMFFPGQTISYEQIGMDVENWMGDLEIYIHYPGQLMEVFDSDPKLSINISSLSNVIHYPTLEVSQLQVLRKRFDGRQHCRKDTKSDVDTRWREAVMDKVGCIPTYWKSLNISGAFRSNFRKDCDKSTQYEILFDQLFDVDGGKVSYEPSCTQSTIISTMLSNGQREDKNISYILLEINHSSEYYIEVINVKAKSFEDLWSQIGGVIGICLGFSLLQIPDFLFKIAPSSRSCSAKVNRSLTFLYDKNDD